MEYAVVIEKSENNFGAWVPDLPDLPGCVSTGQTLDEVKANIAEAIAFHLESLIEHGEAVPQAGTSVATVRIPS